VAKENTVYLYGQIEAPPIVKVRPTGEPATAHLVLKCVRRSFIPNAGFAVNSGEQRVDSIPIITTNAEIIKQCCSLRQNDMVFVKGVVTTRNVKKSYLCPNGHRFQKIGTKGYITPIFISARERGAAVLNETVKENGQVKITYTDGVTPASGMEILNANAEISNQVFLIGVLVRDPIIHYIDEANNICVAQYQVAANRRYRIPDNNTADQTDYPWIKTINKQAIMDYKSLKKGSLIMINGAVQSREVERTTVCDVCGEAMTVKERIIELFPYSVEYLRSCVVTFDKKNEEDTTEDSGPLPDNAFGMKEDRVSAEVEQYREAIITSASPPPLNKAIVALARGPQANRPSYLKGHSRRKVVKSPTRAVSENSSSNSEAAQELQFLHSDENGSLFAEYWGSNSSELIVSNARSDSAETPTTTKNESNSSLLIDCGGTGLFDDEW